MYRAPLCAGRKSGKNPHRERDCRSRELSRASPASYFHPFQRGLGAPPLANGAESQRRTHIRRSCRPRWSDPCLRIRPPRADGPWRTNRRTFDEGREPVGGGGERFAVDGPNSTGGWSSSRSTLTVGTHHRVFGIFAHESV